MAVDNYTELEKKAGQKAARQLRTQLRTILGNVTVKQTGTLLRKSGAGTRMKFGELSALTVFAPHYAFKQHHGFEGIKSNGARMRMKSYDHFGKLFNSTNALEQLADSIANIRSEQVTSNILF